MDLEGQRVVSRRAGCTKSGIWKVDRIKRFVRSPGSRAVEEAKEGQRDTEEENETEKSTVRRGEGIERQERKSPFLSSEEHLLFLEDTP